MPLCPLCTPIFRTYASPLSPDSIHHAPAHRTASIGTLQAHQRSLQSLSESVTSGCPICSILWEVRRASQDLQARDASDETGEKSGYRPANGYIPWIRRPLTTAERVGIIRRDVDAGFERVGGEEEAREEELRVDFAVERLRGPERGAFKVLLQALMGQNQCAVSLDLTPGTGREGDGGKELAGSTASMESWENVPRWIERCERLHGCAGTRDGSWYPTRMLEILGGETGPRSVRIVHSKEMAPVGPYVALSHCWGRGKPLELTKTTMAEFTAGIAIEALPPTFRDAVVVCYRLGINYLWIDSLCIMQDKDDLSDWRREAGKMSQVYSNSYCTLAAAAAFDCHGGLFQERNSASLQRCLDMGDVAREPGDQNPLAEYYMLDDQGIWWRDVDFSPLGLRAWVVQERTLSPRTIFFGKTQILFECFEHQACENFPDGFGRAIVPRGRMCQNWRTPPGRIQSDLHLSASWSDVASKYSRCGLTRSTDKLVAVSGIATKYAQLSGDEYVAGMWRRRLPIQLTWLVSSRQFGKRYEEYRAPTFSWASMDGPCDFGFDFPFTRVSVPGLHIDNVQIDADMNGLGTIRSGFIRVRSCLKSFHIKPEYRYNGETGMIVPGHVPKSFQDSWHARMFLDEDPNLRLGSNYHKEKFYYTLAAFNGRRAAYLLLQHCGQGQFKRIGVAMISKTSFRLALEEGFEDEANLPCERYEEQQQMHIFSIV